MRVDRLRQTRELRGLSQRDLAERVGIHPQQLYRIETGHSNPSGDTLISIAKALEVSLDYLVGLVDEPDEHFTDDTLTPMERRLIWAYRHGYIVEALKTLVGMSEGVNQTPVSPDNPAIDG